MLEGGPAGYGNIQRGDNVVVYATFKAGEFVQKGALRQILSPAQLAKVLQSAGSAGPIVQIPFQFTVAVVPSARVLNIQNPVAVEGTKFSETDIPVTWTCRPRTRGGLLRSRQRRPGEPRPAAAGERGRLQVEASLGASYEDVVGAKGA